MLVNWKVDHCEIKPKNKQSPDYVVNGEKYWFFKYDFCNDIQIDVIGTECSWNSKFEKKFLHFYVWQSLKAYKMSNKYDLVLSHGAQSGIFLAFLRRVFGKRGCKHVLIDVGSFNSASAKNGLIEKFEKFASKSIDGVIIHESNQINFYKKYYPWLVGKSRFIYYGAETNLFIRENKEVTDKKYVICVGTAKRDWKTLLEAYKLLHNKQFTLLILGKRLNTKEEGVLCLDSVSVEEMIDLIQKSFFCVLPLENLNYSFGQMTFLQECLLGKAVVAARVDSIIDYGIDNKTCLFYEPNNYFDLSQKLNELSNNSEKRENIGCQAKKYILENFTEEKMGYSIINFIRGLLNQ